MNKISWTLLATTVLFAALSAHLNLKLDSVTNARDGAERASDRSDSVAKLG